VSLNPKITIYIPSKNYARFLNQSIESVLNQTIENWELLLIDDNSHDSSIQVMNTFSQDSRISVHSLPGLGLPAVANYALYHAKGDFFMRLDGDDYLNPFALQIMTSVLEKNKDLDFVFPDFFEVDEDGRQLSLQIRGEIPIFDHFRGIPPHGACTIWQTDSLRQIGGYREDLKAQDGLDVWLKSYGTEKFQNIALPLFYYRKHDLNLTNSKQLVSQARGSLKLEASQKHKKVKKVCAVIPCRSRFDFTPELWKCQVGQKSLLELSIEACALSPLVDEVVVLGDSRSVEADVERIRNIFSGTKPISFYMRSLGETQDNAPIAESLKALISKKTSLVDNILVLKHLHAPFVTESVITEIISSLLLHQTASAALVAKLDWSILSRNRYGLHLVYERNFISTNMESYFQYRNTVMAILGQNLSRGGIWGSSTTYVEGDEKSNLVVDSPVKFKLANYLLHDG
jgi:hypothetical protein